MAPTAADFNRVSEKYREEVAAKKAQRLAPSRPVGIPVVQKESSVEELTDDFFAALDTPAILPVTWLPEVPETHPIRQQQVHVLLWDAKVWSQFRELVKLTPADFTPEGQYGKLGFFDSEDLFQWWAILQGTCTPLGVKRFFKEETHSLQQAASQLKYLKDKYDGPKHRDIMLSIANAAATFNGLKPEVDNRDAKKLDTTAGSTSSGESLETQDAPSPTPPSPPPENLEQPTS